MTSEQETFEPREALERAQKAGIEYAETVTDAALAGLRTAFDLQLKVAEASAKLVKDTLGIAA